MALTDHDPLVLVEGLHFNYANRQIFHDFHFKSERKVTIIRGPSGCGKTTLLKLIYGLLEPKTLMKLVRPEKPFLILQSDALVPWFSGRENIQNFSQSAWDNVRASTLFELISSFIDQRACDLSYGQRRSIELVRGLCARPGLLMLDEPFNFLDDERRSRILQYINGYSHAEPIPRIVLTTHYVEETPIVDADSYVFRGEPPYAELVRLGLGRS